MNDALASIAAHGLPGERRAVVLGSSATSAVIEQRLAGLALAAHHSGALVADDAAIDRLVDAQRVDMANALRIEALACDLAAAWDTEGFDWRMHKGPAVAYLDYPDVSWRSFGDLDVLVRGEQFDAVIAWFEGVGGQRRFDEPRPGFTARFGKGVCVVLPCGLEVDVHRALVAGPFGVAADPAPLWERPEPIVLGHREVRALSPAGRFVGAAVHAVLGRAEPRLVPVRDVAQMLERDVDAPAVLGLAASLHVAPVVARAVLLAVELAPALREHPLVDWAFTFAPTRRDARLVGAYLGPRRSYRRQVRAGLAVVPGLRAKIAYAQALGVPDRGYLGARGEGYGRRLVRALRQEADRPR